MEFFSNLFGGVGDTVSKAGSGLANLFSSSGGAAVIPAGEAANKLVSTGVDMSKDGLTTIKQADTGFLFDKAADGSYIPRNLGEGATGGLASRGFDTFSKYGGAIGGLMNGYGSIKQGQAAKEEATLRKNAIARADSRVDSADAAAAAAWNKPAVVV